MELLFRSFDEDLGADDRRKLDRVLDGSAEARTEQERVRRLRRMISQARANSFGPRFAETVMGGLDDVSRTLEAPAERAADRVALPQARRRAAARPSRLAAGIAAATLLAAAVALLLWLQPKTIIVPYGSMQTVELADGSVVELSSGSRLTYSNFIGRDTRRVELEGEAFFDIAEAERPFTVETFNASVSVLGTQFNVRAWPRDPAPETSVTVASGAVAVESLKAPRTTAEASPTTMQRRSEKVVLEPGQSTSVVRDSTEVRQPTLVPVDQVLSWRSGGLTFVDQPVGTVFRAVERRFDVAIEVSHPAIRNRLLTYLNPQPGSAEEVLADVCHTLDLRYRRTANGFAILPSPTP